jgi:hypothetical protein
MPIKGARYRVVKTPKGPVRLAFKGPKDGGAVVEAKNIKTGATHTPAQFRRERKHRLESMQ